MTRKTTDAKINSMTCSKVKSSPKRTMSKSAALSYCKEYLVPFAIAVIATVIGVCLMLIGPKKLSEITDLIAQGIASEIDMGAIKDIGLVLIGLYVTSYGLSALRSWIISTETQRLAKKMRHDINIKINRLPMSYFNTASTGDILSRVSNDVDTIGQSLNRSVGSLISGIVLFVGSLVMMLTTNAVMAFSVAGTAAIGFVLVVLVMKVSQKHFQERQENLGALNGQIEEIFTAQLIVKAYNAEAKEKKVFDVLNDNLRKSSFKANTLSSLMMPIMNFISNFAYVVVCVVGAVLIADGEIGFGVVVAFMVYVRYFTQPLGQMAQSVQMLQSAVAAANRVSEFLGEKEMPEETNQTKKLAHAKGHVEFDHVRFGYTPDNPVIKDFTAEALPGQKISIVGPTGAGKTTLVNLLMKFYDLESGDIKIDDVSINDMTREEVHNQFCMVLQDTWLFEGTIRENIVYASSEITDKQVVDACKAVGIDHYIQTLPKGYDTILDSTVSLSQGQKQQLTIARAMIDNKPMLILDEATSSVDTHTELQIQKAMDALSAGRTSFVIAHRLSTVKDSDLILVVNKGDIIESGTHSELLAKQGFYFDLYNSQFE